MPIIRSERRGGLVDVRNAGFTKLAGLTRNRFLCGISMFLTRVSAEGTVFNQRIPLPYAQSESSDAVIACSFDVSGKRLPAHFPIIHGRVSDARG